MARRLTTCAILTSMSLTLFLLEGMLPLPFIAPGAKLGLSNIITLVALYKIGTLDALMILLVRNFLSVIFIGSPTILLFSMSGGLMSFCAMIFFKRTEKFSVIGVSAAGGFFHNLGQIIAAVLFMNSGEIVNYISVLGICGIVTGTLIGFVSEEIIRRSN